MSRRSSIPIARIILIEDDRVLLVNHVHPARNADFWCFPGGGVEPGEGYADAAVREMLEETGLVVELKGLVHVQEFLSPDITELYFLGNYVSGRLALGSDPEVGEGTAHLRKVEWVTLAELHGRILYPEVLARDLAAGRYTDWPVIPVPAKIPRKA